MMESKVEYRVVVSFDGCIQDEAVESPLFAGDYDGCVEFIGTLDPEDFEETDVDVVNMQTGRVCVWSFPQHREYDC